jgi:hypothetical protein
MCFRLSIPSLVLLLLTPSTAGSNEVKQSQRPTSDDIRFGVMDCFLSGHGASARAPDRNSLQKRWLGLSARRLQPSRLMTGAGIWAATTNVDTEITDEMGACVSFPCVIAVNGTSAYSELRDACEAAGGVFHIFDVELSCESISYLFLGLPLCWKISSMDATCSVDSAEAEIDSELDLDESVEVVSHTGTTDFSSSTPAGPPTSSPGSCTIVSTAVDTARNDLDGEVVPDAQNCTSNPCVIDVESYQEFSAILDACKAAGGSFHVFSVVLKCTSRTVQ